jgi:hypothetical protein
VDGKGAFLNDLDEPAQPVRRAADLDDTARIETEGHQARDQGQKERFVPGIERDVDKDI